MNTRALSDAFGLYKKIEGFDKYVLIHYPLAMVLFLNYIYKHPIRNFF